MIAIGFSHVDPEKDELYACDLCGSVIRLDEQQVHANWHASMRQLEERVMATPTPGRYRKTY